MSHEKPVIGEIHYNSDYMMRYFLGNNQFFYENLKKEVPVLDMIQKKFNDVNQQYSWIVAGNQRGYVEGQLDSAKVAMDDVFQVLFAKPLDKSTSSKTKDDNT